MARPTIHKSIHGRRMGLDHYRAAVSGHNDVIAATTSENIDPVGVTTLSSASATYTLTDPEPGQEKEIFTITTSTAVRAIQTAAANFQTTDGSTFTTITFASGGQGIALRGLSTALWHVISHNSSAALTTST